MICGCSMSNPDFNLKLGKPQPDGGKESRLAVRVVKAIARQRAPKSRWANALTRRPVAELARAKGALYGLTPPQPGWRRVIVKARIARHGTSDLAAARSHQHYLMRDGVTPEGGRVSSTIATTTASMAATSWSGRRATPISFGSSSHRRTVPGWQSSNRSCAN
jgi:hypothetical protein